jgi:hypothetical protein
LLCWESYFFYTVFRWLILFWVEGVREAVMAVVAVMAVMVVMVVAVTDQEFCGIGP